MVAILNFVILDSAIFHKTLTQTNSIWLKLILFSLNLMMSVILNSAIFYSAILNKKNFTHLFWLNLMMAAILNSTILDSATVILDLDTLLSSFRFTPKHSHSSLTLTQTNSILLKLIHSYLTWWCQPISKSSILDSAILNKKKLHSFILTEFYDGSHLEYCHLGFSNFAQNSDSN